MLSFSNSYSVILGCFFLSCRVEVSRWELSLDISACSIVAVSLLKSYCSWERCFVCVLIMIIAACCKVEGREAYWRSSE